MATEVESVEWSVEWRAPGATRWVGLLSHPNEAYARERFEDPSLIAPGAQPEWEWRLRRRSVFVRRGPWADVATRGAP